MRMIRRAALLATAAALFVTLPAAAQEPPGTAEKPDSTELREFTEAYVDIEEIRTEMEAELAGASAEESQQIEQQANQKMVAVLQEQEMELERYTEITSILNEDPILREQFAIMYQKLVEERGD